jgi:predicted AlkP superfamily phosphohydrolase/phosphomutase
MAADLTVIALDGADESLVGRFGAEGALPNLIELRARSSRSLIETGGGLSDDALWASFQYAVPLGHHDRYFWRTLDASTGRMHHAWVSEPQRASFWDAFSSAGRRVAVFDLPKCVVAKDSGAMVLTNWLVHGRYGESPISRPESLADEVIERFGRAPLSICGRVLPRLRDDEIDTAVEHLLTSVRMKRDAVLHYLASGRWDVFMTAFKEIHCVSHMLWNLVDASHPAYDPQRNRRLGEPVKRIFGAVDEALGEILSLSAADGASVIFSTTGFAPTATAAHLFAEVVDRIDRRLSGLGGRVDRMLRRSDALGGAYCCAVPHNENCGAVRLKMRGRDRGGRIRSGTQYARTLDRIIDWLGELRDVAGGQPVIADVTRLQERYAGPAADNLPDLLVHWALRTSPRAIASRRLGTIRAEPPFYRPGDHAGNGWLLAAGGCTRPPERMTIDQVGDLIARTMRGA